MTKPLTHYRLYQLDGQNGPIIKGRDLAEPSDEAAIEAAMRDPDCPACEVWSGARQVAVI